MDKNFGDLQFECIPKHRFDRKSTNSVNILGLFFITIGKRGNLNYKLLNQVICISIKGVKNENNVYVENGWPMEGKTLYIQTKVCMNIALRL